jgi:hypothetical protein
MASFETISEKLNPHATKTQILVEFNSKNETIDKALSVLGVLESEPILYSVINKNFPSVVIFYITSCGKDAVLSLIEAGFRNVKGMAPEVRISKKNPNYTSRPKRNHLE